MIKFGTGVKIKSGIKIGVSDNDMILVYEIPSPNTNIELAIQANSTWFDSGQEVVINWGDDSAKETVSATSGQSGYIGHTYTTAGTYTIKISGSMKMYGRSGFADIAGQGLLTRVDSFGKLGITSFAYAFYNCSGLMSVPKTLPDNVTNMYDMFQRCRAAAFNPDVSNWDVSNVTDMGYMFFNCYGASFNPDVSNWDVSKVTNTSGMFSDCYGASFNPDVSNWNVSNVRNMNWMFTGCSHQNFRGGRGADGLGIANWTPKSLSSMHNFMLNARIQESTYLDSILNAWAALIGDPVNPLPTGITCHFGSTKYTSAGADSFALLTAPISSGGAAWTITSGGLEA